MSRHECIKMFELVMRLLFLIFRVVHDKTFLAGAFQTVQRDYDAFMGELAFKDGDKT